MPGLTILNLFATSAPEDFRFRGGQSLSELGLRRLQGGRQNIVFAAASQPIGVLRIGWLRSQSELDRERSLHTLLAERVPVPRLVGELVAKAVVDVRTNTEHPVVSLEYIHGHALESEDDLVALGVSLSRLHAIPAPLWLQNEATFSVERFRMWPEGDGTARLRDLRQMLFYAVSSAVCGVPPVIAHGDLSPQNIIVRDGVATILDLEGMGWGHRLTDLGSAAFGAIDPAMTGAALSLGALLSRYDAEFRPTHKQVAAAAGLAGLHLAFWRARHIQEAVGGSNLWVREPIERAHHWAQLATGA